MLVKLPVGIQLMRISNSPVFTASSPNSTNLEPHVFLYRKTGSESPSFSIITPISSMPHEVQFRFFRITTLYL